MNSPTGVLVMAHGTPARAEDVEAFYTRIRRGHAPSAEQLADLQRRYDAIGGLSPLTERTEAQVRGIEQALHTRAPDRFVVAFGAKHVSPLIEEGADALKGLSVDGVIGLVLTPHGSSMGSGEYLARAEAALEGTPFTAISKWYEHPDFVLLLSARVQQARQRVGDDAPVIFTAHSLPERVRAMGDDCPDQLEHSARLVAEAAGLSKWSVAWQSAGRTPEPWLGPDVRDVVRELGDAGSTAVVVCPIGFVSDHLEVLYDLDVELAQVAEEAGMRMARTESLNDDPAFMGVLADVVVDADQREH
jgi:ferrochelatase